MHAGEGLWNLCAVLTALERKANGNPEVLRITGLGHESLRVMAEYLKIPLPDAASLEARVTAFLPNPAKSPQRAERTSAPSGEVRVVLGICDDILAKLEDLPGNAEEFRESVQEKVTSMREWIETHNKCTDKMRSALENMQGGVNKWLHAGEEREEE